MVLAALADARLPFAAGLVSGIRHESGCCFSRPAAAHAEAAECEVLVTMHIHSMDHMCPS